MNKELWLVRYGLDYYDKFDVVVAMKEYNIKRLDYVVEIELIECYFDNIHVIDEMWRSIWRSCSLVLKGIRWEEKLS